MSEHSLLEDDISIEHYCDSCQKLQTLKLVEVEFHCDFMGPDEVYECIHCEREEMFDYERGEW